MITILLSSLLFIFALICITFSSTISPITNKFLSLISQLDHNPKNPPQHSSIPSKPAAAAATTTTRAGELRGVFATFDKNNDGYITKHELSESLKNIGITVGESDVADMVQKVDFNGDGLIDYDEFCQLFDSISSLKKVEEKEEEEDGDLREAFEVFDGNKDGLISVEELGLVLSSLGFNQGNRIEDCKEMISKVDVDGDGMVDFYEFKKMMKSGFARLIPVS